MEISFTEHEIISNKFDYFAKKYGLSKEEFSQRFKDQFGITFKSYKSKLIKRKINELLVLHAGDINRIASYLGWKKISLINYIQRMKKDDELKFEAIIALNNAKRNYTNKKYENYDDCSLTEIMIELKQVRAQIKSFYDNEIYTGKELKELNSKDNYLTNLLINRLGNDGFINMYLSVNAMQGASWKQNQTLLTRTI